MIWFKNDQNIVSQANKDFEIGQALYRQQSRPKHKHTKWENIGVVRILIKQINYTPKRLCRHDTSF